jgi:hypothetical protein
MTIRRMRIACYISKDTGTHSEYVTFIAFPQQQRWHKCTSMLRLQAHCLACLKSIYLTLARDFSHLEVSILALKPIQHLPPRIPGATLLTRKAKRGEESLELYHHSPICLHGVHKRSFTFTYLLHRAESFMRS